MAAIITIFSLLLIFPALIVIALFRVHKIQKIRAAMVCPQCNIPFGDKAINKSRNWFNPNILDGLPLCPDGIIIKCASCSNEYIMDFKDKIVRRKLDR